MPEPKTIHTGDYVLMLPSWGEGSPHRFDVKGPVTKVTAKSVMIPYAYKRDNDERHDLHRVLGAWETRGSAEAAKARAVAAWDASGAEYDAAQADVMLARDTLREREIRRDQARRDRQALAIAAIEGAQ